MTLAFWCVFAAAVLPFLFAAGAKWSKGYDNANPRNYLAATTGWRQRAYWAHLNTFEAFPPFAAAVVIAHVVKGPLAAADCLAVGFVALRVVYGLCYIGNAATLRSVVWIAAQLCVVGLFIVAAR